MAQLSNGETYYESPTGEDEKSSWQQLLQHIKSSGISITGMSVVRGNIEVHAMPHKMCDGYLQAYEARVRWMRTETHRTQGVGSVVGDQVFITWVDLDGLKVMQEVRPLDSCKVHTTLQ
jgi:hypothetical protein